MSKAILLVGGGKGGVGKSLFSMAVVDFLGGSGREPFLVETDTSVPDVFKTYKGTVDGELVNLDEREGWMDLVNLVDGRRDDTVVINTGARNQTGISNFGKTLRKALPTLNRKLVVFWLIDRKREPGAACGLRGGAAGSRDTRRPEHVPRRRDEVRALQRIENESGDRNGRWQVAELSRARGPSHRCHEQGPADDR